MTDTKELSPAARAVLNATAVNACLAEWGTVNDPPCHPDDEGWTGCHLCVKRDLIAAALRAAVDHAIPVTKTPRGTTLVPVLSAEESRKRILAIAAELASPKADYQATAKQQKALLALDVAVADGRLSPEVVAVVREVLA